MHVNNHVNKRLIEKSEVPYGIFFFSGLFGNIIQRGDDKVFVIAVKISRTIVNAQELLEETIGFRKLKAGIDQSPAGSFRTNHIVIAVETKAGLIL